MRLTKRRLAALAAIVVAIVTVSALAAYGSLPQLVVVSFALLLVAILGVAQRVESTRRIAVRTAKASGVAGFHKELAEVAASLAMIRRDVAVLAQGSGVPQEHFEQLLRAIEASRVRIESAIDQRGEETDGAPPGANR